jgi:hypothetical protein
MRSSCDHINGTEHNMSTASVISTLSAQSANSATSALSFISKSLQAESSLASLFSQAMLWRGNSIFAERNTVPSGFDALDEALPGGGWPRGALTELLHAHDGLGELSLVMPTLATQSSKRRIAFVAPPYLPYAPALAEAGVQLEKLTIVQPDTSEDAWWAAEAMMRSGQFAAVLFWPNQFDHKRLRRLQSATEVGKTISFVFHEPRAAEHASPAPLRVRLASVAMLNEAANDVFLGGANLATRDDQLQLTIIKRRGGMMSRPIQIRLNQPNRAKDVDVSVATVDASSPSRAVAQEAPPPESLKNARLYKLRVVEQTHERSQIRAPNRLFPPMPIRSSYQRHRIASLVMR